ncbi:hypothetical protein [Burkholderia sp. Nafp2/4-1b]|uniref:hypothetical protein n=1 Tax=Burkholderia sp. Nafp2/4-1b TaxID=2116686 RepID=UPI0013CF3A4D|nr:hypothetical protein [Burkholderia sp. Nafp2/4-1b]
MLDATGDEAATASAGCGDCPRAPTLGAAGVAWLSTVAMSRLGNSGHRSITRSVKTQASAPQVAVQIPQTTLAKGFFTIFRQSELKQRNTHAQYEENWLANQRAVLNP